MSVKIRLAKFGKKHAPTYRLVVSHTRTKRNGQYLDILGSYNPKLKNGAFVYDKEKLKEWQAKGALLTEAAEKLIKGDYKFVEYNPKKEEKSEKPKQANTAVIKEEEAVVTTEE